MHSALLDEAKFAILMHVLRQSAYECFISFAFRIRATKLRSSAECAIVQSKPKALQHKPCRFLGNTKRAVNLHAGNAVLAIDQDPKSSHPLVQSERRIFKNGADLQRELLIAATAQPNFSRLNKVVLFRGAARAKHLAVRESQCLSIFKAAVRIGEVNDGFL